VLALTAWLVDRHPPLAVNIALSLVIVASIGCFSIGSHSSHWRIPPCWCY